MNRTMIAFAALAGAVSICGSAARAAPSDGEAELSAAWDGFAAEIGAMKTFIRNHPYYQEPENQAVAYTYLSRILVGLIEEDIVFDRDFPNFRVIDPRTGVGGDNPDQRYLLANIRGGDTYRIWGKFGKVRRLDFQIYAGDPFIPKGGRMAAFLGSDNVKIADDGSFEVWLSPTRHEGNWIENPADASQVIVRQIFSDWTAEVPGSIHIDRVGHEGDLKPVMTAEAMTLRLRKATEDLDKHVKAWPAMVGRSYLSLPANTLAKPYDPGAMGGVPGRFMVRGNFDLAPDEALIIRTWPMSGNYQGIQLADPWYSSLEYGNRQTSLTGDQSHRSGDGSYYYVVSETDPGVPNWLDTYGRKRGVIMLRFDGMKEKVFDPAKYPTAEKVKLSELRTRLPGDMPKVTPKERAEEIALRRRHVQLRYSN